MRLHTRRISALATLLTALGGCAPIGPDPTTQLIAGSIEKNPHFLMFSPQKSETAAETYSTNAFL